MDIILAIYFASVVLLSIATYLDVVWTDRGIRGRWFIEGNKIMGRLFNTNRPSLRQLWLYNIATTIIMVTPSFVGLLLNNVVLIIGGLGFVLGNAAHHYFLGYKRCKKLMGL